MRELKLLRNVFLLGSPSMLQFSAMLAERLEEGSSLHDIGFELDLMLQQVLVPSTEDMPMPAPDSISGAWRVARPMMAATVAVQPGSSWGTVAMLFLRCACAWWQQDPLLLLWY